MFQLEIEEFTKFLEALDRSSGSKQIETTLQGVNQVGGNERWPTHERGKLIESFEFFYKVIAGEETKTRRFAWAFFDHHRDVPAFVKLLNAEQMFASSVDHLKEGVRQVLAFEPNEQQPKAEEERVVVVEQSGRMVLENGQDAECGRQQEQLVQKSNVSHFGQLNGQVLQARTVLEKAEQVRVVGHLADLNGVDERKFGEEVLRQDAEPLE